VVVSVSEEKPMAEARECSVVHASASFHVTVCPLVAGKDMIFLRTDESLKATVLESSSGHQQYDGLVTVVDPVSFSSHATH
jgi:hypothetical protein